MALFGRKKGPDPEKPGSGKADVRADGDSSAAIAADGADAADARVEFSEKDIAIAKTWFAKARKLFENRNYDYAIESYITGLKSWPEAVEEGHQPLRLAAYSRRETGGKKPGTIEAMKRSMSGRDPVQALLNAEWLWSHDPGNLSYIEAMIKNASKARLEETLLFIGPIYFEALKSEKKLSKDKFQLLLKSYEEMGDRCARRRDYKTAVRFFDGALTVLQVLQTLSGSKMEFAQALKDMATKVTIIKGKYDTAEDFRGSIKDSAVQKQMHDQERGVLDDQRLGELIETAREAWRANPGVPAKLAALVDVLCKGEDPARENEAIALLEAEYKSSGNYQFKSKADDIRMKQLRRARQTATDKEALKEAKLKQLRFEIQVFKERVQVYPTENKLKFELGRRLMEARMYDEAIPLLQSARNDPKNRIRCMSLIGRCFYEKGYPAQAIDSYRQAIAEYEIGGDDLSKEMHYWLGRSLEAAGKVDEAAKAFGQLIQWDYNYRDVRDRLDAMGH